MANTVREFSIGLGDIIKSLDYPGNNNFYCVGKVTHIFADGFVNCDGLQRFENGVEVGVEDFGTDAKIGVLDDIFPGRITVIKEAEVNE
jgi:hypothetical protein